MFENVEVLSIEQVRRRFLRRISPTSVARSLLRSLKAEATGKVICVVEKNYVDIDYSASYYEQRGRSFSPTERITTRIHFFSKTLSKEDLGQASAAFQSSLLDSYLGYVVIRPGIPPTLGRSFIKAPGVIGRIPARFPTRTMVHAHLLGIPLQVEACPYMSQDERIMACATAAVWMSSTPLVDKVTGISEHSTAEITSMALALNRPYGPAIGKRGLALGEIEHAFLALGFDPQLWTNPNVAELRDACHVYTDSGIPPVLLVETENTGHAITVVGYTLIPTLPDRVNEIDDVVPSSFLVPNLVVHDDQRGMYLRCELKAAKKRSTAQTTLLIHTPGGVEYADCIALLVPFPRRVMLDSTPIQVKASEWIEQLKKVGAIEQRLVISRTFLVRSNQFKEILLKHRESEVTHKRGYPEELVRHYRGLPMPRYIWVNEVAYVDHWDPANPMDPPIIADFIFDSTSTETEELDYLSLHVPGLVVARRIVGHDAQTYRESIVSDHAHLPFPNTPRP